MTHPAPPAAAGTSRSPAELLNLIREYSGQAAATGPERDRLDAWSGVRGAARRQWDALLEAERFAQDVSGAALWKLLPHSDGPLAQRHDAFIHPLAPAVQRDVRGWFEGAGWVRPDQWPELGRALFDLVRRCVDHPGEVWQATEAFLATPGSEPFTSELVSPVLHALRPGEFPLVDAATRTVLNHVTGSSYSGSLRDFPAAHVAARRLLADLRPVLAESALCDRRPEDAFEGFCHWLVHVKLMRQEPQPAEHVVAPAGSAGAPAPEPATDSPPPIEAQEGEASGGSRAADGGDAVDAQASPAPATAVAQPLPAGSQEPPATPEEDAALAPAASPAPAAPAEAPVAAPDAVPAEVVAPIVVPAAASPAAPPALRTRARSALLRRGQLVLSGAPGSGKSHLARRLAEELVREGDGLLEHLVFHPAWRYADFVQSVRPDGSRHAGRFTAFCRLAAARKGPCVLLIDDAERAELADAFGEALALLDTRGREVALAGGGSLVVPANVLVVLTLDASGRAGRAVLSSLLNACAVLRVDVDAQALRERHAGAAFVEPLLDLKRAVDAELGAPDRSLPLGFFLRADLAEGLEDIWRTEVEPWLGEALTGEPSRAAAFRWEAVAGRLSAGS
jgi:hypothetical protein